MNQKWIIPIFVFFLLIISITIYFSTGLQIESAWAKKDSEFIVTPKKVWEISFSEKVDPSYLKEPYIFVTNEHGKQVKILVSRGSGPKSILISPPIEGYQSKMDYTLNINRKFQSIDGKELRRNIKILFTVKETVPVVSSR
ncbi:Ig-like domain-containing protein [Neobacillus sp. D3-1R]|uniref:Ig-like domain-containing protein n=1 Tax=Neobacillus sp. D3-1R TaxID=3445778 RepID=UPI003F9F9122